MSERACEAGEWVNVLTTHLYIYVTAYPNPIIQAHWKKFPEKKIKIKKKKIFFLMFPKSKNIFMRDLGWTLTGGGNEAFVETLVQ